MSTDKTNFQHSYSFLASSDLTEDEDYKLAILLNQLTEDIKTGSTFSDKHIGKLTKTAFENSSFENKEKLKNILDNFLQQLNVKITDDGDELYEEETIAAAKEEPDRSKEPETESFMDVLRVVASEEPVGGQKQDMAAESDISIRCCCINVAKLKQ
jgi:hypothetical protein